MKRFPLFLLAALLGVAASAPAQLTLEGRIGRAVVGKVTIGDDGHRGHREHRSDRDDRGHRGRRPAEPVRCLPPIPRGHWQTIEEQVLVPGYWQEQHVPPTYGWITDRCGHRHWGVVDAGGCRRVWIPARWETRCRRVWVPC
ncbi:MAG: hypothetical protein JNL08_07420 [Planctomycetes bacterium]|nr:hypothetical protein [Planctomycetota bacterium]